ncbi:hypothetical protein BD770DRAFT_414773 [Pilaira anomala]|nr:hypothetical protein BD770DRAFT_414773 [Pilaira anomala]
MVRRAKTKNYILLELKKKADVQGHDDIRVDKNSWHISYKKDDNCFSCRNISSNSITMMKNVEYFINVWTGYMNNSITNKIEDHEAQISLSIQGEIYSGYLCSFIAEIPQNVGSLYSSTLKNII